MLGSGSAIQLPEGKHVSRVISKDDNTAADLPGETGSPRKQTKADMSRERVLEAAARTFSERGYAGTTMRDIARAADLQAGSLYYHYPSKELLIEAVIDQGIHNITNTVYNAIAKLPPSSSYGDRVRMAIHAHLRAILTYGAFASASRHLLSQVPVEVRRKHILRRESYEEFWLGLLQTAHEAGETREGVDLRLARTFILGGLNSALDWYRPEGKSIEELADQFATMIEGGILKGGSA